MNILDKMKNQKGVVNTLPLFLMIAIIGVVAFLLISSTAPLGGMLGLVNTKEQSHAAVSGPATPTPTPTAGLNVSLSMSPVTVSVLTNQTFSVNLLMNTSSDRVSAVDAKITFDPTKVQAQTFTAGTLLPVVLVPGTIDNTAGTITFTFGSQPTTPAQGTGTLATVVFKSLTTAGTSQISYAATTQTASVGKTGNTVGNLAGTGVTIKNPVPGDLDLNGVVDIFDYNLLVTNFGKTGTGIQGDIDGNGRVDIFDYNIVVTNFGTAA